MSRPSKHGRMGHSFGSETTTSAVTSPPTSPRESDGGSRGVVAHGDPVHQPMYYVQSPSRDSFTFNEGDSLSHSFAAKSSPSNSPLTSPLHKSFASKPLQLQNVPTPPASYQAGNPRPGSRRVLPQPSNSSSAAAAEVPNVQRLPARGADKGLQLWSGATIQEEGQYGRSRGRGGRSKWCIAFLSILLALFCAVIIGLTYWLVCRPSAPKVQVKGINFQNFFIATGNDPTGVPTQVLSVNCTTALRFDNPSKYFGFHVSAPAVQMYYEQIQVADGESPKFFQKKRSIGSVSVNVHAVRTPVYGAGPSLLSEFTSGNGLPLQLRIGMQSQAYVIWKLVRPEYKSNIACDLVLDTNSTMASSGEGAVKISSQNCHRG